MNNVILVGRVNDFKKTDIDGKSISLRFNILVNRNYKNEDGIYEEDIIPCFMGGSSAETFLKYCNPNDIVGIKGHITNQDNEILVFVMKASFLKSGGINE